MTTRLPGLAVYAGLVVVTVAAIGDSHQPLEAPLLGLALAATIISVARDWYPPVPATALLGVTLFVLLVTGRRHSDWLFWLAVWAGGAVLTWTASEQHARARARSLERRPAAASSRARLDWAAAAALFAVLLIVLPIAAASTFAPPSMGRAAKVSGASGDVSTDLAPYLGMTDSLDTSARGAPGKQVVLRVKAAAPEFWRGSAFDQYDGRTWTQSAALQSEGSFPEDPDDAPAHVDPVDVERFTQSVQVEAPAIGTIFGAPDVVDVNLPPDAFDYGGGGVQLRSPLGRGSEYTAISFRSMVTADILREHDPNDVELPPEVASAVQEGGATPRVAAVAEQVAGDAPTTYDAVRELEAWLGVHTKYTLDIPPLPEGADTVEQFLFVDKRGFCMQIASSLTVMLRSVGIPARVATGFVSGDESALGGEFTVRASDAHAWVEVWFPGIGWQGFDPTASVPLAGEYSTSMWARIARVMGKLAWVLVVAGLAVAAFVGARLLRRRARARSGSARPWVSTFFLRVEKEGAKRGRPRRAHETPAAYISVLRDTVLEDGAVPGADLDVLRDIVSAAAYSGEEPSPEQCAEAERILALACRSESG